MARTPSRLSERGGFRIASFSKAARPRSSTALQDGVKKMRDGFLALAMQTRT
jgi:hypothetical protein